MRKRVGGWAMVFVAMSGCCSAGRAQASDPEAGDETALTAKDPALIERVRAMLSGYEHVPTAEDWARAGEAADVAEALMTLANEPGAKTTTAARATSSLGFFPRPEVAKFLVGRTGDERVGPTLRGKAAIALGLAFGDDHADDIAALLSSSDAGLREDAVRAFRHLMSPAAERFLETRMALEPAAHIREAMVSARTRIAETRKAAEDRGGISDRVKNRPAVKDPGPIR